MTPEPGPVLQPAQPLRAEAGPSSATAQGGELRTPGPPARNGAITCVPVTPEPGVCVAAGPLPAGLVGSRKRAASGPVNVRYTRFARGMAVEGPALAQAGCSPSEERQPHAPGHASRADTAASAPAGSGESLEEQCDQAVAQTLVAAGFTHTLELGIVLGLEARFLLALSRRCKDAMHRLVQRALPCNLEDLARALASGPLCAHPIADEVRELSSCNSVREVEDHNTALVDALVSLLNPLSDKPALLLCQALGITRAALPKTGNMGAGLPQAGGLNAVRQVVHQNRVGEVPARDIPRIPSCRKWVDALAKAGTPASTLREIARSWLVPLPPRFDSWDSYTNSCYVLEKISEDLLHQHREHPDTPVPLRQVWPLVRSYVDQPFFALALDDGNDEAEVFRQARVRSSGPRSLLGQAAASGCDGLSWAALMRLVRCGLIEPVFIRQLSDAGLRVETVSRPLHPSDLLTLVLKGPASECEALEVMALLGRKVNYGFLLKRATHWRIGHHRALAIWLSVYGRPWCLETGHLVQVFRQLGRQDLVARLTGDADSHLSASVPLDEACPRASRFIALAQEIRRHPVAMLKFMAHNNLSQHPGWCAPEPTAPAVRLLACLARDSDLLELFRSFMDADRASCQGAPGQLNLTSSGHPTEYLCPISHTYMQEPVPTLGRSDCVIYFDKQPLLQALTYRRVHPMTNDPLSPDDVRGMDVDLAYLARIHQWRRDHPELEEGGRAFAPPDSPALQTPPGGCGGA